MNTTLTLPNTREVVPIAGDLTAKQLPAYFPGKGQL
jgi:hypothetical protein